MSAEYQRRGGKVKNNPGRLLAAGTVSTNHAQFAGSANPFDDALLATVP